MEETAPQSADDAFVLSAKAGDYAAFEQLVSRHERRLYALAWHLTHDHHDAQDVVQNSLLAVVEHLSEFRQESSFATWITRITVNHALKLLRTKRQRQGPSLDGSDDETADFPTPHYIADWRDDPQRALDRQEVREVLDQGMELLTEGQRLVFVLRDVEGLSVAETAEAMGISPGNVKVRLLRARLALREYLTVHFGDESTRQHSPGNHDHDHSTIITLAANAASDEGSTPGGKP